jgi:hypothetical protein
MERNYDELLNVYNNGTQIMIQKIRDELNADAMFSRLETDYDVYDLLNFNEFNLKERLERLAFHMKDFKLKYLQELAKVEAIKDRLDKVTGEKYQSLRNGAVSLSKTEIEKYYLTTDVEILNLKGLLRKQEMRAQYFEAVHSAFDKMGWNIRNYVDLSRGGY